MQKISAFFRKTLSVSSSRLITILSLYFLLFLNISFWRFIFVHAEPSGLTGGLFMLSIPLVVFTLLYMTFSILLLPYVGKPLLILILLISAGVNYLTYQFGVFIDADMVRNTFETNPGEVKDLITFRSVLWFVVLGVLPSVWLAKAKITFRPFGKELLQRLKYIGILLLCVILFTPFVYKQYASFGRNNNQVRRLVIPLNYIYATYRYFQIEHQNKRPFTQLDAEAAHVPYPDEEKTVFILILGETARAKNFSLNGYPRETNPLLKKQDIVNFRHVRSAGTATAFSVPAIFSFTPRSDFDPTDAKYTENLLDLLQQTGYEILWKENDNGCKGVCQRVPNVEMDVKDKRFCDGTYCHDEILLEGLEDYLAHLKSDHAFIVLHTFGSHGPTYFRRYPPQFKKFTPTCDTEEIQTCTQEQIVNTYDNTILYTDYIVSSAIDILKKFPTYESGLMYLSDHGESLGENGVYLHGLPYAIAPEEQTTIPMVVWMSDVMKKSDHLDYECLKKKAAEGKFSHDNLSHSLLSLMEVDSKVYNPKLDIFESCRLDPLPRKTK